MTFKISAVQTVRDGYIKLFSLTLSGGGPSLTREVEDHGSAAAVLPYDPVKRTALLVRAPRAPVIYAGGPETLLEAPAGMIEAETAEAAARREALEEVGVRLRALEPVARAWSSPGVSTERIDLFLAAYGPEDRTGPGGGVPEEQEHIVVVESSLTALWSQVETGEIADLKTLALLMALRLRRPALFEVEAP